MKLCPNPYGHNKIISCPFLQIFQKQKFLVMTFEALGEMNKKKPADQISSPLNQIMILTHDPKHQNVG